jgi:hypothetical protein
VASQSGADPSPQPQDEQAPGLPKHLPLPWARQEFYLSRCEDGKVGFHNFRSLQ